MGMLTFLKPTSCACPAVAAWRYHPSHARQEQQGALKKRVRHEVENPGAVAETPSATVMYRGERGRVRPPPGCRGGRCRGGP